MKTTPLYANHQKRNGKCVEFAGYQLPVWFNSIQSEHRAVRESAGCFDISHMGVLKLTGPNAAAFIQYLNTNDVAKASGGKVVYSMILNEQGGILDDVTFGELSDGILLVVNGANKEKILDWISHHRQSFSVDLHDLNTTHAFIAVQGPKAEALAANALNIALDLGRFTLKEMSIGGLDCIVSRTGYTGEDGFEFIVPNDGIDAMWDTLIDGGIEPCGLGARDSLRIEAGLPLYGHELTENIHPFMTRYPWVVKFDTDFIGKEALMTLKEAPPFTTVGLEMIDKGIPRQHYEIAQGGSVTSGTMSPTLKRPIAMALVDPKYAKIGTELDVIIRSKPAKAKVTKIPFI